MSSLTKVIEEYLHELLVETQDENLSLRRKDLAERFKCVPSQINYVLASRFTPERGYLVESQRGGHGFIRIIKIRLTGTDERLAHFDDLVGETLSEQESRRLLVNLQERKIIASRERLLIEVSLRHLDELCRGDFDVSPYRRDVMRADLMKRHLRAIILS